MARGHPQETVKLPNPFSRLDRAWLLQNPIPHNHTINTVVLELEPPIEVMGRAQAAKVSSSLFSREKQEKGTGRIAARNPVDANSSSNK
jgi:hypothetical protein